jgi:hypothetical protein
LNQKQDLDYIPARKPDVVDFPAECQDVVIDYQRYADFYVEGVSNGCNDKEHISHASKAKMGMSISRPLQ